ncbi:unnamed protein product [Jaminaea pallidilutea]
MKTQAAERTEESKACKKYNCLREKLHWLWAKYRNAEVDKRIHKPTEAQKAKTKLAIAARRAKDEVAFKAQNAKKTAACRSRRTRDKVESDKEAALASLTAKDKEDPTRIVKRKLRHNELEKIRRLKAKQTLLRRAKQLLYYAAHFKQLEILLHSRWSALLTLGLSMQGSSNCALLGSTLTLLSHFWTSRMASHQSQQQEDF